MSEKRPDFVRALQRAEAELQAARPSPALDQRVLQPRGAIAWGPLIAVVAAAVLLIALLLPERSPKSPNSAIVFSPARCAPKTMSSTLELSKGCEATLERLGLTLTALSLSELKNTPDGVQLVKGEVRVQSQPAEQAESITMIAAGARVRFSSAELVLAARGAVGSLKVLAGRAMLREPHKSAKEDWLESAQSRSWGQTQTLLKETRHPRPASPEVVMREPKTKGQTPPTHKTPVIKPPIKLRRKARRVSTGVKDSKRPPTDSPRGTRPTEETPEIPPSKPLTKSGRVPPAPDWEQQAPQRWSLVQTNAAVRRVTLLRAQRHYARAAALIAKLLEAPLDPEAAEVLSYERGDLLEAKLPSAKDACVHWRAHRARFGQGRYSQAIQEKLKKCASLETARPPGGE